MSLSNLELDTASPVPTEATLLHSLDQVHDWFVRMLEPQQPQPQTQPQHQQNPNLQHGPHFIVYHPHSDTRHISAQPTRELCALWHASLLGTLEHAKQFTQLSLVPVINHYLSLLEEISISSSSSSSSLSKDQETALILGSDHLKDPSIAHNAFLMLLLLTTQHPSDTEQRHHLVRRLGNAIIHQQQQQQQQEAVHPRQPSAADLSVGLPYRVHFNPSFPPCANDPVQPAQAMLALVSAYEAFKDEKFLSSVCAAFPAYKKLFTDGMIDPQNLIFASSWFSQACAYAYRFIPDRALQWDILHFLLSLQSDIIDADKIGFFEGLKQEACSPQFRHNYVTVEVACALEGLVDVFALFSQAKDQLLSSASSSSSSASIAGERLDSPSHTRTPPPVHELLVDYNQSSTPSVERMGVGQRTEWSADALKQLHSKMELAITQATEFLLQVQRAVPSSPRGRGGFGSSLVDPTQRLDIAGHIASAFSKIIKHRITLRDPRLPASVPSSA